MGLGRDLLPLDSSRRRSLPDRREAALSDLRTVGLAKTYGNTEALRGIDLHVPAGVVYGLVGPNGSGKTTTLEILAGLRHPSAGRIELGVERDSVAYCPDTGEFEPWLSALEVLDVAAGLLGRPHSRAALGDMLERVGLSDSADRRVGGFSRGMRTRLGLAAGLIGEPRLLIADEPAAALDPAGRWEILDVLAALSGSVTVLVSSHDLPDVERICDRIGVLAKGRLVYQGALTQLLAMAAPALRVVVRPPANRLFGARTPGRQAQAATAPGESPISQPTVIAWGELDPVIPAAWADRLGVTFPDHELSLLPGIGHFVPIEAPEQTIETIRRALALAGAEPADEVEKG